MVISEISHSKQLEITTNAAGNPMAAMAFLVEPGTTPGTTAVGLGAACFISRL